jgi:hypothetical protein
MCLTNPVTHSLAFSDLGMNDDGKFLEATTNNSLFFSLLGNSIFVLEQKIQNAFSEIF